jgi:hypothetical protein
VAADIPANAMPDSSAKALERAAAAAVKVELGFGFIL